MGLFNELAKIEVRQETVTPKSDLDRILDAEAEIIKQYENDGRFELYGGKNLEAYPSLYQTAKQKLTDIKIIPEILQSYIDARENPEENTQALIRGMYSAALLEIITTKTPEAHTVINGRGKKFNYLFYHIHTVKNLTLHNVKGNRILYYAGACKGGSATYITLENIKGNYTLANAGKNGSATNITLNNITGHDTLSNIGWNGNARYITLQNIIGDDILSNAGADDGSATNITLQNIKGNGTLNNAARNNGNAKNITLHNITGTHTFHKSSCNKKDSLQEHQLTAKQKSILSQIKSIVETIQTISLQEQKAAHDEIARLQKEIFSGEA